MAPYAIHDAVKALFTQTLESNDPINNIIVLNRRQGATTCIIEWINSIADRNLHIGILSVHQLKSQDIIDALVLPGDSAIRVSVVRNKAGDNFDMVLIDDALYVLPDQLEALVHHNTPFAGVTTHKHETLVQFQSHSRLHDMRYSGPERLPPWHHVDDVQRRVAGVV